jgi:hypothetical protein
LIHAFTTMKRRMTGGWSPRLAVLLAFALASCGGSRTSDLARSLNACDLASHGDEQVRRRNG